MSSLGFEVVTTVAKVLGAPVGICDQAVEELAAKIIQKYVILFERLKHQKMPAAIADVILRTCGVPCMGYLTRVVAPARLTAATKMFDECVLSTFLSKHSISHNIWTEAAERQVSLHISSSGF